MDCIQLALDVNERGYVLAYLGLNSVDLVTWNNRAQWHTLVLKEVEYMGCAASVDQANSR